METNKVISATEQCPQTDEASQEKETAMIQKIQGSSSIRIINLMAKDNEKLIPLFWPCYLVTIGFISLIGINIIDPALLESANWKQNTIWSALLFFGLIPPFMRSTKGVWLIMGYVLAFFIFGGGNIYGTVQLVLSIFKICLPVFILFQMFRLWGEIKNYSKWILLLPIISLILAMMILTIEDKNIFQSSWNSLINWSWDSYRSDNGFHTYLGGIGILTGISEFLIIKKYINN
ncbi:hypothetical protein [Bacteroides gallinarum]|uniref:hypothetical protein n=1 Tax=Bacteroides gallinarum TaxID=376806 RepID=UPI000381AE9D|nr:hypothetical protein [Bacteroides gallinarum]